MLGAATPQEVDQAIKKGVEFLWSRQKGGSWEIGQGEADNGGNLVPHSPQGLQSGGVTAMAVYTLLAAGESDQKAEMKAAIKLLQNADIRGTYALGMRAQVWPFLRAERDRAIRDCIARDATLLRAFIRTKGEALGLYRYGQPGDDYDHSCSNYGVLGMWAIAQTNYELPCAIWEAFDAAWRRHQLPDGGWCYQVQGSPNDAKNAATMSMTSAGVATLFITQDYLYGERGLKCEGNLYDEAIEHGIKWMSENFEKFKEGHTFYSLYNIERVGVASGRRYFGKVDWYKIGADFIVKSQNADGSWGDTGNTHDNANGVPFTSWAVLFLVRGRAPIMMNKLEYTVHTFGDKPKMPTWNERPRDMANLSRWTARQVEEDHLNWQIVDLGASTVEELHDSPILYISGKEALNFTKEEEAKLKLFVEQGGLILGNADCSSRPFADSFKKLGTKLFGGEFQELRDDHPIYTAQEAFKKRNWKARFSLQGLSNGGASSCCSIRWPIRPSRGRCRTSWASSAGPCPSARPASISTPSATGKKTSAPRATSTWCCRTRMFRPDGR